MNKLEKGHVELKEKVEEIERNQRKNYLKTGSGDRRKIYKHYIFPRKFSNFTIKIRANSVQHETSNFNERKKNKVYEYFKLQSSVKNNPPIFAK